MRRYLKIKCKMEGRENLGESIEKIHQKVLEKVLVYHLDKMDTNDEEFYYAVGQLFHYLFSLGYDQKFDNTSLDPNVIKRELENFMSKYAQDIKMKIKNKTEIFRFANLLSLIFAHQPQNDKIYEDYFLAGLDNQENAMFYKEE